MLSQKEISQNLFRWAYHKRGTKVAPLKPLSWYAKELWGDERKFFLEYCSQAIVNKAIDNSRTEDWQDMDANFFCFGDSQQFENDQVLEDDNTGKLLDEVNDEIIYDSGKDENFLPIEKYSENVLLPGTGEITLPPEKLPDLLKWDDWDQIEPGKVVGCGTVRGLFKLEHKYITKYKLKQNSCFCKKCPECFREWASKQGRNLASDAIAKIKQIPYFNSIHDLKYTHGTFSLDPERYPVFDYKKLLKLKKRLVAFIKEYHRGSYPSAYFILHPYQLKKHCAICDLEVGGRIKKHCGQEKFYDYYWKKGIHFHCLTNFSADWTCAKYQMALKSLGVIYKDICWDKYKETEARIKENGTKPQLALFYEHNDGTLLNMTDQFQKQYWRKDGSFDEYKWNQHLWFKEKDLYRLFRYELGHCYFNPEKRNKSYSRHLYFNSRHYHISKEEQSEKYTVRIWNPDDLIGLRETPFYEVDIDDFKQIDNLKIFKTQNIPQFQDGERKYLMSNFLQVSARMKLIYKNNPNADFRVQSNIAYIKSKQPKIKPLIPVDNDPELWGDFAELIK